MRRIKIKIKIKKRKIKKNKKYNYLIMTTMHNKIKVMDFLKKNKEYN